MKDEKERALLTDLFSAIMQSDSCASSSPGEQLTDLFVQIDNATGEVQIYDDDDRILAATTIYKWIDDSVGRPTEKMKASLKVVLHELAQREFFDHSVFGKPLSVQLQDKDPDRAEELIFIDDDLIRIDDPLLAGMDEDLDDFLSDLLGDSK